MCQYSILGRIDDTTGHRKLLDEFTKFPEEQRELIQAELDRYVGDSRAGTTRVHLAILRLSEGNLELLRHNVKVALKDFRDVLWWAEGDEEYRPSR
jgi:hypothetical protein